MNLCLNCLKKKISKYLNIYRIQILTAEQLRIKQSKMSLFGNWKLKTSTKFDEYMKEVGVNWALRKAGAACSSTTEITQVF